MLLSVPVPGNDLPRWGNETAKKNLLDRFDVFPIPPSPPLPREPGPPFDLCKLILRSGASSTSSHPTQDSIGTAPVHDGTDG